MPGIRLDLVVERNAGGKVAVRALDSGGVNPRTDLTGWTGLMQVRAEQDSGAELLATGVVTIDTGTAIVTGRITADSTLAMDWETGYYDLFIIDGSDPTDRECLAWGEATFARRVSHT